MPPPAQASPQIRVALAGRTNAPGGVPGREALKLIHAGGLSRQHVHLAAREAAADLVNATLPSDTVREADLLSAHRRNGGSLSTR